MSFKRAIFVVIVGTLCTHGALVSEGPRHHHGHGEKTQLPEELQNQLKEFLQTEIIPQRDAWKAQIDAALEAEDLLTLNELRSRSDEARKAVHDLKDEIHTAYENDNEEAIDDLRDQLKELRSNFKDIKDEVEPIADKYEELLETIRAEAKGKAEVWRAERREMIQTYFEANGIERDEKDRRCRAKGIGHKRGGKFGFHHGRGSKEAHLLLWNGAPEYLGDRSGNAIVSSAGASDVPYVGDGGLRLYQSAPNPATANAVITFELPSDGFASVKIFDLQGREVQTLLNERRNAGQHTATFDAAAMQSGLYFCRLTFGSESRQIQISVGK